MTPEAAARPGVIHQGPRRHWLLGNLGEFNRGQLGFYVRSAREHGDVVPVRLGPRRGFLLPPRRDRGSPRRPAARFCESTRDSVPQTPPGRRAVRVRGRSHGATTCQAKPFPVRYRYSQYPHGPAS
jgi:hypothetical protein